MSCKVKPSQLGCRIRMPRIGLGTWRMQDSEKNEEALHKALEIGYRHLDTAFIYGNETSMGKVLKKWYSEGHSREEVFITSKLPPFGLRRDEVGKYLCMTLEKLQTDYIDLYIAHMPFGFYPPKNLTLDPSQSGALDWSNDPNEKIKWDYCTDHVDMWKGFEKQYKAGRAKNIGVSNFNVKQIERIINNCEIRPHCLQVEMHPFLQQQHLSCYCRCNDMVLVGYSPFASFGNAVAKNLKSPFDHESVKKVAKEIGCTPAQAILAFIMHLGAIPIPKTNDEKQMKENFEAQNIELNLKQMRLLKKLHIGEEARVFNFREWDGILDHPEYPWKLPESLRCKSHSKKSGKAGKKEKAPEKKAKK